METRADAWEAQRRVLCVRLDTIGDVLMTTPALRALREQRPDRQIAMLTSRPGALAAALVPEIDRTILYDAPWMKAPVADPSPWRDCAMVEQLRAGDFDAAVVFATYSQSPLPAALTCHLAGIPRVLAHCRENPYRLISDWVPEPEPESGIRHEVQRHLDLVATVGAASDRTELSLEVPREASVGALRALREAGQDPNRPWLLVQPGATAESRRYPVEHYAEAMRRLADETGSRIVVSGDRAERALVEGLATTLGDSAVALAGRLSFPELCALIAAAPLLVCGNTGPAHVAAAVGTPVVVLYALTNPQHTPWGSPARVLTHDVPCRWCLSSVCREGHHACLRQIEPAEVVEAAMALLAGARPRPEAAVPTAPPVVPDADQAALGLVAP